MAKSTELPVGADNEPVGEKPADDAADPTASKLSKHDKAWIRKEVALRAAGLSHEEREAENP